MQVMPGVSLRARWDATLVLLKDQECKVVGYNFTENILKRNMLGNVVYFFI